ncbi:GH36-type glycosyl hydrolase domain-containing protein [Jeotgalibacillus proteolyticus]|uniref:Cellobiose phosphorylase n=1 Tax=Jeotgalibacillus proteolyticus TaxID=2082395 RepID=A0A2S5GAC8_9BACL|nr:amylo-alpha-1,6-glucosidase [Jeotgalibacillus proteolyticus]PPA69875.1 cellobiose phosphorylase [Jeotgalibacillus proteolyticus]
MLLKTNQLQLNNGDTTVQFLPTGDISTFSHKHIMINQLQGNTLDGSLNNLYLRVFENGEIVFYPLAGKNSTSTFSISPTKAKWEGTVHNGITYEVIFHLASEKLWFWEVKTSGAGHEIDVIYGQDMGLADKNAVRSNEAYIAQYVDHAVFNDSEGYVVCSRQNQPQGEEFPYLEQGSLGKNTGYSTDGFQFFGLSYKETNIPEALTEKSLENKTYQYEFAYTALQSERIHLNGNASFVFYGGFAEDHAEAVTAPVFKPQLAEVWEGIRKEEETFEPAAAYDQPLLAGSGVFASEAATLEEINQLYPERTLEEWDGSTLLSFFTPSFEHIILKEKELQSERSHGHILMSGENHQLSGQPVITSTSYTTGVFNAQLVIGNTTMNKLLSNVRNALNVFKASGQRIYMKMAGEYKLLTMPAVYELGFNYARWIYKLPEDRLTITVFTATNKKSVTVHLTSENGIDYDFAVTNQVIMNGNEYDVPYHLTTGDDYFTVSGDASSDNGGVHPDLAYRFSLDHKNAKVTKEENSLLCIQLERSKEWTLTVDGSLTGDFEEQTVLDFNEEKERYKTYFKHVMNHFELALPANQEKVEKVNAIAWWYTHNMLVHYSVPHGLEQYGGAAWGTRDVCQGPTEYFLATAQYDSVKEIIKTVYSHQYEDKGSWPQWFMFDAYSHIQQDHSHGDVIVWPLKVVADYLTATNDASILEMPVPYTDRNGFSFTQEAPLLDHIKKQISTIKNDFLHDTHLSSYGDGDWDDTLQPANQQLRQYMVSSWTVALTYQSVRTFAKSLKDAYPEEAEEFASLAEGIRDDFRKYLLKTDVIPGFLYFEDPENPENMVHPDDQKTGIHYRLLPMTRSMISELLTPEEAEKYRKLVMEKFYYPDGVRLMSRPANYEGGVSKHFKRAEQAANFGREIGLQYVHAHIRFVEAMAKLGRTEEVWKGLETINPIGITSVVPNAEKRQSNAYFSSSDGKFNTRYEAQERFAELRTGDVAVKGGWRIYSSGPGIYMNQLISNALGFRQQADHLIIDPVLPASLDGLEFTFKLYNKPVTIRYHLSQEKTYAIVNGQKIESSHPENPYRQNGIRIRKDDLYALLTDSHNLIEIWG